MTQLPEHTIETDPPRDLRIGEAASFMFGENTEATKARVMRLIDRGELAAIRVGDRRDRLIPRTSIEAFDERAEHERLQRAAARA